MRFHSKRALSAFFPLLLAIALWDLATILQKETVLFLAVAILSFGQSNYAVVTGSLSDGQQPPVAEATIQLTAENTGAARRR